MRQRFRAIFKEIFPNERKRDLSEYLSGINQDQVKKFILKIIQASNYNSEWNDWKKLLYEYWFHGENIALADEIFKRVILVQEEKVLDPRQGSYLFLTKTCTLFLLEEILKTRHSEIQKSDLEIEIDLFKAILIINEIFDPIGSFPVMEGELSNVLTRDVMLALSAGLGQFTLNNSNLQYLHPLFVCQQRKALYLFNFLKQRNPELLAEFLKKYACTNTKEYIENLTKLIYRILLEKNHQLDSDSGFIHIDLSNVPHNFKSFINALLIYSPLIEDNDIDFIRLRSRPLIEYKQNDCTVINESFVIQKLYNSPYFDLRLINDTITKSKSNFRSYFTYEFAEKTLFYNLLKEIFSRKNYVQYSGEEIRKYIEKGGTDYYIRNGNKIFLFENKDNLIGGNIKQSRNFDTIKKFIDDRLVKDAGIPQLINNIRFTLDKSYKFDEDYQTNSCVIYPIIVTHTSEFDNPGLNLYLKYVFKDKLNKLTESGYNISRIKELTLINIDTLIIFSNSLKIGKLNLNDAIDSYHRDTNKNIENVKNADDYDIKLSTKMFSFYTYLMAIYAGKKKIDIFKETKIIERENIQKISNL